MFKADMAFDLLYLLSYCVPGKLAGKSS